VNENAEEFMDKWLDENVKPTHLKRPENLVAKILAKRCIADAEAAGVEVASLEHVVVDIEEAIVDELRVAASESAMEKPAA
jgi:hypothetical protein